MPNHIFINRESGNDNISIFYDEPSFVVIANKDDLASIQLIDESKKPGIYILLGDDKRYIGQASNAIFNRLQQHYINKPWWNKLIFFGREDGHLSKEDFFELLDIPKSYWKKPGDVDRYVLKPIREELTPLFRGLTVRKKYGKGRGKPVIGYSFTWKPEKKDANDFSQGQFQDERQKLFNIQHNGELTEQEKWRATDKVKGLPLGSTEKQILDERQIEHDKTIRDQTRQEMLAELRKGFGKHA